MSNDYQWYPGHMTKAKRQMQEDIKLVDLVIELLDARIPYSSRNPDIDELAKNKSRLVLLNKADLADEEITSRWVDHFKEKGISVVKLDSRNRGDMKKIDPAVQRSCREKLERNRARGIIGRPVRAMVVGIPNVGKSTFINSFAKKAVAKTGNKPGVTKGKQWIRLSKTLELLDTPGILWPKFEDKEVGRNLALIGSMNDQILELTQAALDLASLLEDSYPEALTLRYILPEGTHLPECADKAQALYLAALSRNALTKGGDPDLDKAAKIILDDFRAGRLGRISLEKP